ncbi:DUF748 domain-containing protein [Magnetofaba australis]|uniref:AsmA family protein n=1 Tax=Magnetofaba australis IT-1 TaxID=1434232 RepID=A0A1Y2K1I8_9PROT|nr:DUF748 domain-containing protein [Magnetofaba australis]OSM01868.1 hypothetical protein MAIT1_01919 [Magnetofaba australis IT-1]
MNRRAAIILLAAAVGLTVLGALSLGVMRMDAEKYRPQVLAILQQITGRAALVGEMDFLPTSGVTLRLKDVVIPSDDPKAPPLARIPLAEVGVGLTFLLGDKPHLSSITLVSPEFHHIQLKPINLLGAAQDKARESSQKLREALQPYVDQTSIGVFNIRRGSVTLIDRASPFKRTLRVAKLDLTARDLAPGHIANLRANAEVSKVPVTLTGQLGPLPADLDVRQMPILLNLEAKSVALGNLTELFPEIPPTAHAERGYASALIHGKLSDALSTRLRLEFDDLLLSDGRSDDPKAEPLHIDLAWRQQSTLWARPGDVGGELGESYLYIDSAPVARMSGRLQMAPAQRVDLRLNALKPMPVALLPQRWRDRIGLHTGLAQGRLHLQGGLPDNLSLRAELDLSDAAWALPPALEKPIGAPLTLRGHFSQSAGKVIADELTLTRRGGDILKFFGPLWPRTELRAVGQWKLEALPELFPRSAEWRIEGMAHLELGVTRDAERHWRVEGQAHAPTGAIMDLPWRRLAVRVQADENAISAPQLRFDALGGHFETALTLNLEQPPRRVLGQFSVQGVSLRQVDRAIARNSALFQRFKAVTPSDRTPLRVEGVLNAQGEVMALLDQQSHLIESPFLAGALSVEPGRVAGLNGERMLGLVNPTEGENPDLFSEPEGYFHWDRASGHFVHQQGHWLLENLRIDVGRTHFEGRALVNADGKHTLNLTRIGPEGQEHKLVLEGSADQIRQLKGN